MSDSMNRSAASTLRVRQIPPVSDSPCTDGETPRLGLWPILPPPDSPKPKIGRRSVAEASARTPDYHTTLAGLSDRQRVELVGELA